MTAGREIRFDVAAYSGLDLWYYLLPSAQQAARVAKRIKQDPIVIGLPSGAYFRVEKGVATPIARPPSGLPSC